MDKREDRGDDDEGEPEESRPPLLDSPPKASMFFFVGTRQVRLNATNNQLQKNHVQVSLSGDISRHPLPLLFLTNKHKINMEKGVFLKGKFQERKERVRPRAITIND